VERTEADNMAKTRSLDPDRLFPSGPAVRGIAYNLPKRAYRLETLPEPHRQLAI
jgi:hypothetical protein